MLAYRKAQCDITARQPATKQAKNFNLTRSGSLIWHWGKHSYHCDYCFATELQDHSAINPR